MRKALPLVVVILLLAGCGPSIPPEASAARGKVIEALNKKDAAALKAAMLPAQREGALGITDAITIKDAPKKLSQFTVDDVMQIQFFADATSVEANDDLRSMDGETTAQLGVTFNFGSSSAVRTLILKKEGNAWLLDLKATVDWWAKMNGSDAFSAIGPK
jgi:hypothetical protein